MDGKTLSTEKQVVTEAFTELAPRYADTMEQELHQYWGISYQAFIDLTLKLAEVKPGDLILDIATGTAAIPMAMQKNGKQDNILVGLDITPEMLKQGKKEILARGSAERTVLVCGSAMAMPFKGGIFQVAICGLGTHHMKVSQMLSEAKRVLAPGGRLILADVCATPFWRSTLGKIVLRVLLLQYGLAHRSARSQAELEAFKNVRSVLEWEKLLRESGFSDIHIQELKPRRPWYPGGFALRSELPAS